MKPVRILFCCLGNICRSPTAEGVFRAQVEKEGLAGRVIIDSAGTHAYHVGEPPDGRASEAAARRGYDLSAIRGRQARAGDCREFDLILAMDEENLANLRRLCPDAEGDRLRLFLDFGDTGVREVPDPYFGGEQGFEHVLDLVENASRGLIHHLRQTFSDRLAG